MRFIGDVHGKFKEYKKLISTPLVTTIQVGDLGVGFGRIPNLTKNDYFIRGNHDNPELCQNHPQYLGDYGIWGDIGYISGAYSIDKDLRTIGVDWWEDEELSMQELEAAIYFISSHKPAIIVTHDCPASVEYGTSKTARALDALFDLWQPRFWIFGHYHRPIHRVIGTTEFRGLEELGVFDL